MTVRAGMMRAGELVVYLAVREGVWYPEGKDGMPRTVAAFAEAGNRPVNPGPLIRVRVGTPVRVIVHNRVDKDVKIFGLGKKRGLDADSSTIHPNDTQEFSFVADKPGTYSYAGKTDTEQPLLNRKQYDSQLNGAIVVDGPNDPTNDRIFLISWWYDESKTARSGLVDGSLIAINGLSWPHTEIVDAKQGEPQRYRWINMTIVPHPMHLHGFYFTTDDDATPQVTHPIMPGTTFTMNFTPTRPGNWLLHCHFAGHMASIPALNRDRTSLEPQHDMQHMMQGIVMGVRVKPTTYAKANYDNARPIRLVIQSKGKQYGDNVGYSFALEENKWSVPGPLLVLKKDQPVAITLVNKSHDMAAVHWHAIELESFPDGVPGFSGYGKDVLPMISQGDSFTVRFTPPRAGTFMYHSHSNEQQQISSGMYGAIVVTDDAHPFNPETDKLLVFGDDGPIINQLQGPNPPPLLNGKKDPGPIELKAGTTYRLRVVNIRADSEVHLQLLDGDKRVQWQQVARDGQDLAAPLNGEADYTSFAGQIADFVFTPTKAGRLTLRYEGPDFEKHPAVDVAVVVN